MNPEFPIYIPSKGRAERCITARALSKIGVDYRIVVESQEYPDYRKQYGVDKLLVLPENYLSEYDVCDDLGESKSKGPGAARNFCWDHSVSIGAERHWVMDDNILAFYRFNNNKKIYVGDGTIFKCVEDFVDRYENVPIAGLNYLGFVKARFVIPPFTLNTRIYSCNLMLNSSTHRWRGRYNEDTDICLRVLKDGSCTVLFNAFLAEKTMTQRIGGGCTEEFYRHEGTLPKSEMLERLHPDVSKVSWKFNRWHHHVDYSRFKRNKLVRRIQPLPGINNYGMKLVSIKGGVALPTTRETPSREEIGDNAQLSFA